MSLFKDLFVAGDVQADKVTVSKGIDGNQGGGYAERAKSITKPAVIADYFQKKLVSGVNIATINGQSLLGSGNIGTGVLKDVIQDPNDNPVGRLDMKANGLSSLLMYKVYNNISVDYNTKYSQLREYHVIRITAECSNTATGSVNEKHTFSYGSPSYNGNGGSNWAGEIYPVDIRSAGDKTLYVKKITYYYL